MLIKLDSGNLLNLSAVSYISNTKMLAYFKQPVITNENNFETAKCFGVGVTEADIERIANNNANKEVTDDE
jgi:flagellar hook-associated protein FlgK